MIEEYIDKASLAITEGLKNIKKGKITKDVYYHVVEEYFNNIYKYIEENIDDIDASQLARIHSLENSLNDFIIDFKTNINAPNEVENSDEYLLETIVYFTRKQLKIKESIDFSSAALRKQDRIANDYVSDMCNRLGLPSYCFNVSHLFDLPRNHNICIVNVNSEYYLVDCTYQQYFLTGLNFENRYLKSTSRIVKCEVGRRILKRNPDGARQLLEKGYINCKDITFEDYFDTMFEAADKEPLDTGVYLEIIINRCKKKMKNS